MTTSIAIFGNQEDELTKLYDVLRSAHHQVHIYTKADSETINEVFNNNINIVLIDLHFEHPDGIELCYQLKKEKGINAFVVIYSEASADYIQVEAFNAGADDYMVKPINPRVLVKRINALLSRQSNIISPVKPRRLNYQNIIVDREQYKIYRADEEIILPRKEFEILYLLISQPKRIFSREEIFNKIWDHTTSNYRVIDVHVRKIRKKLGDKSIRTVKGVGYQVP
ncbi:MAG: response regulator transcription factor [Flavobacteriales bacterium]|nr:response regulator transcription factor [Flavobacteriales bacterium]